MSTTPTTRGRGQPSRFSKAIAAKILALAKAGRTEAQIAAEVGIGKTTLTNWKGAHPDFLAALKDAKSVADALVEASLFSRACGYSHQAVRFFYDSKTGKVVSQPYLERHPPDTTACIFWLKNRRPDLWRDSHRLEHTGQGGGPVVISPAAVEAAAKAALTAAVGALTTEDFEDDD